MTTVALAATLLAACSGGAERERPEPAPGAPNIIAISVDDATTEQVNRKSMPTTFAEIAGRGTSFDDFIATSPLCCPSRANFLTGSYGHNNGVLRNNYRQLDDKASILPTWLQQAGYRTAHVGKYLNNFTAALADPAAVPTGWDEWYTLLDNVYYGYELSDNGEVREFGSGAHEYVTRVLNRRAVQLVERYAAREEPLYLQLDHYAPHHVLGGPEDDCRGGATPARDDYPRLGEVELPEKRSRNERDVSDKPWFIRALKPLDRDELRKRKLQYICAETSLRSVDRGIKGLIAALERAGALEDTAILLTSDNGYFYGEHRIPAKKEFPYEENLRVPLLVRLPADLAPKRRIAEVDAPTATIDLAPTILELADAEPCKPNGKCRTIDGRSLLPLLRSQDAKSPRGRALLVELHQTPSGKQDRARPCSYVGVRQGRRLYVRHRTAAAPGTRCRRTNAVEHYDLDADPEQLENLAAAGEDEAEERRLRRKLSRLRTCAGNRVDPGAGPGACE